MIFEREGIQEETRSIWYWRHFCRQLNWYHPSVFHSASLTCYKDKRFKRSRSWTCHSSKCHSFQPEVVKAKCLLRARTAVLCASSIIPTVLVLFNAQWGPDKRTKPRRFTGCWPHRHQFLSPDLNYAFEKTWKTTVSSKLISLTSH